MLENLDKVDWKSLNAEYVPQLLEDLLSEDKRIRNNAFQNFDESVVYNGSIQYWQEIDRGFYISKILVSNLQLQTIPFLIKILCHPENSNKEVYNFLIGFAGYAEMRDEGEIYRERAARIKDEIWKSKDIYLKDMMDNSSSVRLNVFSLLCYYNDESHGLSGILLEQLRTEESGFMLRRFESSFVLAGKLNQNQMDIFQELKHQHRTKVNNELRITNNEQQITND